MSRFITPLEDTVQGLQSADPYTWTHAASQRFREAKSHIQHNHTLYLLHPKDQLVIKPDGSLLYLKFVMYFMQQKKTS